MLDWLSCNVTSIASENYSCNKLIPTCMGVTAISHENHEQNNIFLAGASAMIINLPGTIHMLR